MDKISWIHKFLDYFFKKSSKTRVIIFCVTFLLAIWIICSSVGNLISPIALLKAVLKGIS